MATTRQGAICLPDVVELCVKSETLLAYRKSGGLFAQWAPFPQEQPSRYEARDEAKREQFAFVWERRRPVVYRILERLLATAHDDAMLFAISVEQCWRLLARVQRHGGV